MTRTSKTQTPDSALTVVVEAVSPQAAHRAERDALAEIERLHVLLSEARENYEEAVVDRDVPASVVADLEREISFISADMTKAQARHRSAEADVRRSRNIGDRTMADHAAEILTERLATAVKGVTVSGHVVVKPAGRVGVNGVLRSGPLEVNYDGPVDLGVVEMAISRALGTDLAGKMQGLGSGRWKVTVTKPDAELERQYRARRAEEEQRHRIGIAAATSGGYGVAWTGEIR